MTKETPGLVYFVLAGSGHIKIGYTGDDDPNVRLASIQTGNPFPLSVIAVCMGSVMHERVLHKYFEIERASGEWFFASKRLHGLVVYIKTNGSLIGWSGALDDSILKQERARDSVGQARMRALLETVWESHGEPEYGLHLHGGRLTPRRDGEWLVVSGEPELVSGNGVDTTAFLICEHDHDLLTQRAIWCVAALRELEGARLRVKSMSDLRRELWKIIGEREDRFYHPATKHTLPLPEQLLDEASDCMSCERFVAIVCRTRSTILKFCKPAVFYSDGESEMLVNTAVAS